MVGFVNFTVRVGWHVFKFSDVVKLATKDGFVEIKSGFASAIKGKIGVYCGHDVLVFGFIVFQRYTFEGTIESKTPIIFNTFQDKSISFQFLKLTQKMDFTKTAKQPFLP